MAHLHEVRDSDKHFIVDPITRMVSNNASKTTLIQYDHNSEVFTFEMPRFVEKHDMLKCNRIEIHYDNIGSGNTVNHGVYEVQDLKAADDDPNVVIWSWPVSNGATMLVGSLVFAFRFACLEDDVVTYSWSTAPHSTIVVTAGIYNSETVVEEHIDILEQWEHKIGVSVDDVDQTVESQQSGGINVITLILTDGRKESFKVRNGKTPVRGVDYWTEADKTEIINDILEVIPRAEEASF